MGVEAVEANVTEQKFVHNEYLGEASALYWCTKGGLGIVKNESKNKSLAAHENSRNRY